MAVNFKKIFASAIIELSSEKPLEKITINDIVSRVGSGRQTFYNHFLDKNDLISYIFKQLLKGEKKLLESGGLYAYLLSIYTKSVDYQNFLFQACQIKGQNCLAETIYNHTFTYYRDYIQSRFGKQALTDEVLYALGFNAYGASQMYIQWLVTGMNTPPDVIAGYAMRSTPECIKQYILNTDAIH